jgi:hypothetical protein
LENVELKEKNSNLEKQIKETEESYQDIIQRVKNEQDNLFKEISEFEAKKGEEIKFIFINFC